MNKLTQAVVMLLFGGALIKATVTDTFLRYVKAGLRPYLVVAGILLVAAAVMTIWYELRPDKSGKTEKSEGGGTTGTALVDARVDGANLVSVAVPAHEDGQASELEPVGAYGAAREHGHASGPGLAGAHAGGHEHGHAAKPESRATLVGGPGLVGAHAGGHDHGHVEDDGHGHTHEPRVGWLLVLPVIGLLLISPPALGSYSAGQTGTVALTAGDTDYPPLPKADPAELGLLDYAGRAVFDNGRSLTGHTIELSGFLTPGPDNHPMLARIVLTCCAADGRPIKIGLDGDVTIDAPANSWVQVDGVYSTKVGTDPVNKAQIAYLTVKSWEQIGEPGNPYA